MPFLIARLLAWRPAGDAGGSGARGSGVGRFLLNLLILLLLAALILWLLSPRESGGQAVSGDGGAGGIPGNFDGGAAGLGEGLPGFPSLGAGALEQLLNLLEQDGADVSRLENGSAVVQLDGEVSLLTGTSTGQAAEHDPVPLFEVTGAANTGYLRTGVGDVYDGGNWSQLDPVSVSYDGAGSVADSVADVYASPTGGLAGLPEWRRESALLTGLPGPHVRSAYCGQHTDKGCRKLRRALLRHCAHLDAPVQRRRARTGSIRSVGHSLLTNPVRVLLVDFHHPSVLPGRVHCGSDLFRPNLYAAA